MLKEKNKKVLLVNFEMTYTGSPRALLNLALGLRELGYTPDVWTLNEGPFQKEFLDNGIAIKVVDFPETAGSELDTILPHYRFVIANTVFCAAFANYAQHFVKTVLYIMEANNLPQLVHDCGLNVDDIINAQYLLCVSNYAKQCIKEMYPIKRIDVLQNFVEPWQGERKKKTNDSVCFLVSGTIEYRKGQDVAENAFLSLPEEMQKKAELHFVGPAPDWSREYQDELHKKQTKQVIFHEEIRDKDQLFELYDSMDVFIVASRDESCSLVALEAAMLGKALLVTENTGAKYLAEESCILPTGDVEALGKRMAYYITNRDCMRIEGAKNHGRYMKFGTRRTYIATLRKALFKLNFLWGRNNE